MKRKYSVIIIFYTWFASVASFAQEVQQEEKETSWKTTGTPIVAVFANYHTGFGDHNSFSGFEINRAYLGYDFKLTPTLTGKVVADMAIPPSSEGQSREVALKNAFLRWNDKGFTVHAGLIPLMEFQLQEKFWGYRYIIQSYQDLYKMGSSADLGISAQYQFTSWLTADLSYFNGEGYKKISQDNNYRYGIGTTIIPLEGLTFRLYADQYDNDNNETKQQTYSIFGGYKNPTFSFGAEYNYQTNNAFMKGNDYYGYSLYVSVPFTKKWAVFGRYDNVDSKNANKEDWFTSGHHLIVSGVEFRPVKQLRISPNYKYAVNEQAKGPLHEAFFSIEFVW